MNRAFAAAIVNGLLLALVVISLLPLLWMVSVSFMAPGEANTFPPPFWPREPSWQNYRELFRHAGMGVYFFNSAALATLVTGVSLCFNVTAGYAFAKIPFPGREPLFKAMLAALVVPGQVAMMPLFLMLKGMGLVNTFGGVLVPGLASIFGIFLVRQFVRGIPDDLLEAARMDGAGEWRIFWSVILPLLRPVLVTLAVFTFLGSWNDFMWPLIVLTDNDLRTLPVALAALSREHVQDNELMMAGSVVTVLPVLLLFLLLQRHYVQGLLAGSVK